MSEILSYLWSWYFLKLWFQCKKWGWRWRVAYGTVAFRVFPTELGLRPGSLHGVGWWHLTCKLPDSWVSCSKPWNNHDLTRTTDGHLWCLHAPQTVNCLEEEPRWSSAGGKHQTPACWHPAQDTAWLSRSLTTVQDLTCHWPLAMLPVLEPQPLRTHKTARLQTPSTSHMLGYMDLFILFIH